MWQLAPVNPQKIFLKSAWLQAVHNVSIHENMLVIAYTIV